MVAVRQLIPTQSIIMNTIKKPSPVNRFKKVVLTLGAVLIFTLLTLFIYATVLDLSGTYEQESNTALVHGRDTGKPVKYFGVVSRFPAHIIYQRYQPLMDYLNQNTGYHFSLKLSQTYEETATQLAGGEVDAAFMGSYVYATSREEHNLISILKPLNQDSLAIRRSVIIARRDSGIESIDDLRGKTLALASEHSLSGNWLPRYMLARHGILAADLNTITNFPNHHSVIHRVLNREYDAGAVRDQVAREYLNRGIHIIHSSEPLPTSPIVVSRDRDPEMVSAIINALLTIERDSIGEYEPVREDIGPHIRYTLSDEADYDFILEIIAFINAQNNAG